MRHLDREFVVPLTHRVRFVRGAFAPGALPALLEPDDADPARAFPARALFAVDAGVARARPGIEREIAACVASSAPRIEAAGPVVVVPGGEPAKNDRANLDRLLQAIHDAGLCRRSYVVAIGGGAVLDVVGYAAAIAHRGVRLVRVPTTTLAQADSGVGVKNGVNAFGKKNYLGTFAPPWGVVNDMDMLATLDARDWRCGFSEAVKVALIRDAALFERIEAAAAAIADRAAGAAEPVIVRSAELHLDHITAAGDPFETRDARPLDFGHWAAHKLEQMTAYRLRHGEAVAIGLAIDLAYGRRTGVTPPDVAERAIATLSALGFRLHDPALGAADELLGGLDEFREHLGGRLTITLARALGSQADVHAIDRDVMLDAIAEVAATPRPAHQGASS